jgi:DnaJ-class molecular chaperone
MLERFLGKFREPTHLPDTQKVVCAFCKGTGRDRVVEFRGLTCQVCSGRKEIFVKTPYKICASCKGTGVAWSVRQTCTACSGRGVISVVKRGFQGKPCPACRGSGMETKLNLPCFSCYGVGEV